MHRAAGLAHGVGEAHHRTQLVAGDHGAHRYRQRAHVAAVGVQPAVGGVEGFVGGLLLGRLDVAVLLFCRLLGGLQARGVAGEHRIAAQIGLDLGQAGALATAGACAELAHAALDVAARLLGRRLQPVRAVFLHRLVQVARPPVVRGQRLGHVAVVLAHHRRQVVAPHAGALLGAVVGRRLHAIARVAVGAVEHLHFALGRAVLGGRPLDQLAAGVVPAPGALDAHHNVGEPVHVARHDLGRPAAHRLGGRAGADAQVHLLRDEAGGLQQVVGFHVLAVALQVAVGIGHVVLFERGSDGGLVRVACHLAGLCISPFRALALQFGRVVGCRADRGDRLVDDLGVGVVQPDLLHAGGNGAFAHAQGVGAELVGLVLHRAGTERSAPLGDRLPEDLALVVVAQARADALDRLAELLVVLVGQRLAAFALQRREPALAGVARVLVVGQPHLGLERLVQRIVDAELVGLLERFELHVHCHRARALSRLAEARGLRAGIDARRRGLDLHRLELRRHLLEVVVGRDSRHGHILSCWPAYQRDATAVAEPTSEVAADTKGLTPPASARAIVAPICWLVACVR